MRGQYDKIYIGLSGAGSVDDAAVQQTAVSFVERIQEQYDVHVHMGIVHHEGLIGPEGEKDRQAYSADFDLPPCSGETVMAIGLDLLGEQGHTSEYGLSVLSIFMENPEEGQNEDVASHAQRERLSEIKEDYMPIIRLSQRTKRDIVTYAEVADLAASSGHILLHDETPAQDACVYALAAIGLRLGGDDGMFINTYDMTDFSKRTFGAVAQCIGGFRASYDIDPIFGDRTGSALGFHERINLTGDVQAVLRNDRFTVICRLGSDDMWMPYTREDFLRQHRVASCDYFELDPMQEDYFSETKRRTCRACLYRKMTSEGFQCTVGHTPPR